MGKLAFSSANPLYQQLMDDIKLDISKRIILPDFSPSFCKIQNFFNRKDVLS